MKKIRIGNDFVFNWAIERGGLPEDLSSVLEKHLHLSVFGKRVELIEGVDYDITGNVIRIEVTPAIANIIGTYKVEFHYILPDNGLIDEDRKCAVDVDAFQIVARTAQADDPSEFTVTSDMAIAFKGDKGDSAYQVWLDAGNTGAKEDYFAYLRQPAIDAGASISELESEIQSNEDLRVQAENERDSAETARIQAENERLAAEIIRQSNEDNRIENEATRVQNEAERISKENVRQSNEIDRVEAEGVRVQAENERETAETTRISNENNRVTAEQERVNAESLRTMAESSRELAESLRVDAEILRQTNTQIAITNANTAAQNADDARLAIQDDLALKANQTDLVQLAGEVEQNSYVKITNLVTNGNFSNGLNNWILNGQGIASVSNNLATITGTGTGNVTLVQITEHDASPNDKIYFKAKRKRNVSENALFFRFESRSGGQARPLTISSPLGEYSYDSRLVTLPEDFVEGNLRFVYQHYFNEGVSNLGISSEIGNIVVVNLTKTFGAGNEPTKEEMDLLISTLGIDYFEGEITIPAQKIMQWQLKMIRQNRSAIIALGGTII